MKESPKFNFLVKFFDHLEPMTIPAHSHLEAGILACAERITNGQHTDIDYVKGFDDTMIRLYFRIENVTPNLIAK